jgi:hypothetical protein
MRIQIFLVEHLGLGLLAGPLVDAAGKLGEPQPRLGLRCDEDARAP